GSSIKHHHQNKQKQEEEDEREQNKHEFIVKQEPILISNNSDVQTTVDSLLDIDSSDDEDTLTTINNEDIFSLDQSDQTITSSQQCILLESDINNEQQDTREATMWLGTDDGIILIFQCTETMKTVSRKSRIVKQLGSAIHSIL
ncbi:unnamed protein product, partial [Rotaria sp. Silwood1]